MGKVKKRQPIRNSNHHDNPNRLGSKKIVSRRQHSQNVPKNVKAKSQGGSSRVGKPGPNPQKSQQPNQKLQVPFSKWDRVLLVGEGDFSFALSLKRNHKAGDILATCFDSQDELETKYEGVAGRIEAYAVGLHHEKPEVTSHDGKDEEWAGFSPRPESGDASNDESDGQTEIDSTNIAVLFGIDATKLSTTHRKALRAHAPFTKVVFNFPHVGGLSTDVNRQVRSNQELLVNFFNAAKPLLATASNPAKSVVRDGEDDHATREYDGDDERQREADHLQHGQILVTLFEGEPYTLWNIRDLARHSGLKVLESFKFPWVAYPGYQHARTIGDITTGKDRSEDGKRRGKWRGEERDARCYVLALKDDNDNRPGHGSKKRRREQEEADESD